MKLIEKAANISSQQARRQALEEVIAICNNAEMSSDKYDIQSLIKELIK